MNSDQKFISLQINSSLSHLKVIHVQVLMCASDAMLSNCLADKDVLCLGAHL